jgi:Immunity protein Imm1
MTVDQSRFREVWVNTEDGQTLCALINGDLGWLMYLRESGDAGFSSRNPEFTGPEDEIVEYYLSNGQRDEYPRAWALPVADVERALDYFRRTHEPPPFIVWHNDSGDGVQLGRPG